MWSPWGETPLNEKEGYRPWVRDPKALEEDLEMGLLLEATIGLEGESPRRIVWHI